MRNIFIMSLLALIGLSTNAANSSNVSAEDFRCETAMGIKLAEFKEKLIENCNLKLPFSSSMSRILNEESYFYCCHKK